MDKMIAAAAMLSASLTVTATVFAPDAADGDLAAPGNWTQGVLPGAGDAAEVDGAAISRSSFTLSDNLTVGALAFLNWSRPAAVDLGGKMLSAASAQFGGAGPVALANGTLQTAGALTVSASSALTVSGGATVRMPACVPKGGELKLTKAGARLVVDGGTFLAPATETVGYGFGNALGDWGGLAARLEVVNGGRFEVQPGRSLLTMVNASRILVDNAAFVQHPGETDYPFVIGNANGNGSTIAVTNSLFCFHKIRLGGTSNMELGADGVQMTFHDSVVTSSVAAVADSGSVETHGRVRDNRLELSGADTKAFFSVNFRQGSTNNVIVMRDVAHVGDFLVQAGTAWNAITMAGGTGSGSLSLKGGVRNAFRMENASRPKVPLTEIGGVSNAVAVAGGTFAQKDKDCMLKFLAGRDALFAVSAGATAFAGQWGDNPAISFSHATNACIRIDNATLTTMGYLDWTAVPGDSPGVCLEFTGAAPRLVVSFWQTMRQYGMKLGAADAAEARLVPRLRFKLPKTPYAQSVITTSDSWFRVGVNPTAVLEFDFSECGVSRSKRVWPLIDRIPSLSAETLAALNATANLPEGCRLVASKNVTSNNANGTFLLSLEKRDGGMMVQIQ